MTDSNIEYVWVIHEFDESKACTQHVLHWIHVPRVPGSVKNLGLVVQSIVSLTSSLVVKFLTVLVSTIPDLQVILMKKM